jgi:hypothetical protein
MATDDAEYSLYGGMPPHVNKTTSWAAAVSMRTAVGQLAQLVLDEIEKQAEGATCEEIEILLNMKHQTVSARIRELVLMNKLYDSGATRYNASGRKAIVYMLVSKKPATAAP